MAWHFAVGRYGHDMDMLWPAKFCIFEADLT